MKQWRVKIDAHFSTCFLSACLLVFVFGIPGICSARQPRIEKFRWSRTDKGFVVSARLNHAFNQDISESIDAGIPTSFHYYLRFKQVRSFWNNKIIAHADYVHTVVYDTLRKIYTITIERIGEGLISRKQTTNPVEMRKLMDSFQGDLEVPKRYIRSGKRYYLSLRVTSHSSKLNPPWNVLLSFLSHDFDTGTSHQFLPESVVIPEK